MTVVLLTTNLARGGAETQVAQLAIGLRRRGWNVSVISLLPPSALQDELASSDVAVFSLDMRPGVPNPLGFARLAAILRRLRPQILHSHMFHANLMARTVRSICPAPVVVSTLHSVVETSRRSRSGDRRDWVYRVTDWLADATVAVCEAAAERHAAAKAVRRTKLHVIPNGVDTSRFRPDPEQRARMRHELGIDHEFAWLAVGRLMWKKDYASMLRAFARQSQGLLLIAGTGPQEPELRSLASQLGADVRFLEFREDIAELMNACDGFVLSSRVEGLPVALLEAAASALPCVATEVGGVREIVLHERTGYVIPPGDVAALADAMTRLKRMPPHARQQMGRAAREQTVARFDTAVVVSQWERLYRELLETARTSNKEP